MKTVKVYNLQTSGGNPAPEQLVHVLEDGTEMFFSYTTKIAERSPNGKLTLTPSWNFSQTTGKFRNKFTGLTLAETRRGIADGTITLETH